MADTHVVQQDETLCAIAVGYGFKDCQKLREANPSLKYPLQPGVTVTIPDLGKKDSSHDVDAKHEFKRPGIPLTSVFLIKDTNQANPADAAAQDKQSNLAISNYVTGRQGTGFAAAVWANDATSTYVADASADPDHFKVLVKDDGAAKDGLAEIKVDLYAQTPVLDSGGYISSWNNHSGSGTSLMGLICRRVKADAPWYQSSYLRLVADGNDQSSRAADGTDPADDRSKQTLVVPPLALADPNKIEILDSRVYVERLAPKCTVTDAATKCKSIATADVGKDKKTLRVKVYVIDGTGAAATTLSFLNIQKMLYTNYRMTLAQANVGLTLVDDKFYTVPPPYNMIAVSDYDGVKSKGDGRISVTVTTPTGSLTEDYPTENKKTPEEVARDLAGRLTASGVTCRVSPNPPNRASSNDFGSCDILCFNADGTPAQILQATSTDSQCKLSHTGGWDNNRVRDGATEYGANEPNARLINGMDYRACAKNYNYNNTDHLTVMLVNLFAPLASGGTLFGYAFIPYREVNARIRPIAELQMAVLMDGNGIQQRTVLPHEAGHVLLDTIHTTNSTNPEVDWQGNAYPTNPRLAFSEWMAAFSRESSPPFLHLRMSDSPLTVEFQVAYGDLSAKTVTLGTGGNAAPVERFRTLSASVLGPLRQLTPPPAS